MEETSMHSQIRRTLLQALLASAAALGFALPAQAQDGTQRILVGFPAGGSFDAISRLLADRYSKIWGQSVIVENRPGAGGRIAVDVLRSGPNDGSVVMLGPDALASLYPFTYGKLSYDPQADLVPVGTVSEFAFALASGAKPDVKSLDEFVAWAKANPQQANYGVPARGSPHHFYGIILGDQIGVPMPDVPFQGSAPLITALMGGHVSSGIDVLSSMKEMHKGGKLRVLAITAPQRDPELPEVPTFAELGYPEISGMGFNGLYAPKGTPEAAVERWNAGLREIMKMPDVRQRMGDMGFIPVGQSTAEFAERSRKSAERWEPVIKASGFKAD